ncbi:hypothetical protein B7Z17_04625, partial [Candidatus Saccharibacteria bacterium 32-49-10]
ARLLATTRVAVISGGAMPQFLSQIVTQLPNETNFNNLYLLPTSGAVLYEYRNTGWTKVYEELLTDDESRAIEAAMHESITETGVIDLSVPAHGERIEPRGSQVTLSALGQQAPLAEKLAWDPDRSKRELLRSAIAKRLPEFSVKIGGKTSVDVTKVGIDKAYGVRKLCEHIGVPEKDALYVGDELGPGGNYEAVCNTEAKTQSVKDPVETAHLIEKLLETAS